MTTQTSSWIPASRLRLVKLLGLGLMAATVAGGFFSPWFLLLLVPAVGVSLAGVIMLEVGSQLSDAGGGWQARIHRHVVDSLDLPPTSRAAVLDIGCGDAALILALLDRSPGLAVTGVDYWGQDWDYARAACEARLAAQGRRADFHRMDAARLDFPDASFDAVVSVMCFHEVRAPKGAGQRGPLLAVQEALRVLRPGGLLLLVDRFADPADYGPPAALDTLLKPLEALSRRSLKTALKLPWPLSGQRAMGPVQLIQARKPG